MPSPPLYRQPFPGLVAFTVAFLSRWLGHSTYFLVQDGLGDLHYVGSLALWLIGAGLIATSLRKAETDATWMAFLGAQLLWVGLFDLAFNLYSERSALPPVAAAGGLLVDGPTSLLMATLPVMLTLFLLYGLLNRQTKCNLIRWLHRNLRLSPGMPTPDNGRSIGRIVAFETLFVIWATYLFWLYVTYAGGSRVLTIAAFLAWAAWFAYIFSQLLRYPRVGPAFRYGIPVGIIGWDLLEMPGNLGYYEPIWLKPFDYPIATLAVAILFAGGLRYLAKPPGEGQRR